MSKIERIAPAWRTERGAHFHATPVPVSAGRSYVTRGLHLTLLSIVIYQLVSSNFMHWPFPGEAPGLAWSSHEYLGLVSFVVVFSFWFWTLVRSGETEFVRLFPWFSPRALRAVLRNAREELHNLMHLRFPDHDGGPLVSAIHGLGLLGVTGMAVTGTVYYVAHGTVLGSAAMFVHESVANLIWAYLIAHAGMAVLHHLMGADIFSRMFWTRPRRARRRG